MNKQFDQVNNSYNRTKSLDHFFFRLTNWQVQYHQMRTRVLACGLFCFLGLLTLLGRLFYVMVWMYSDHPSVGQSEVKSAFSRGDILDRHGRILATQLKTASIYANPKVIQNPKDVCNRLLDVFPHLQKESLLKKLSSDKGFVWIERHAPPHIEQKVHELGIPGIYVHQDERRIYPHGELLCHILGYCDVDGKPLGGIELSCHDHLNIDPVYLSIDLRIQYIVFDALQTAVKEFEAAGGNALILDLTTGEVLASVSFPHFNPNRPDLIQTATLFNRNTLASNEPGSTFKILNIAIALESGAARLTSQFDATCPVRIGRFTVTDFKGKNRILSLTEAFVFSSNIAAIKIVQTFGSQVQKKYMKKFGVLEPVRLEIPENGHPLIPKDWRETTAMTVSYGYGVSVTPIQLLTIISGLINEGRKPIPTLFKRPEGLFETDRMISPKTSQILRQLMRLVVTEGTAKKADIMGVGVFGKTGTAYQSKKGGYGKDKSRTTTFIGGFPYQNPRYMILVMLDDPKATTQTHGYATAGWNAAPTAGQIIERVAPILEGCEDHSEPPSLPGWYPAPVVHTCD